MPETEITGAALNNLPLQLGIAVLLLGALIIFAGIVRHWIKSENDKWQETIKVQAHETEQRQEKEKAIYTQIIETIRQDRDKDQKILMSALEDNRQQISVLRTVIEKIKGQDTALQVLLKKTSSLLEDRCRNHINLKP